MPNISHDISLLPYNTFGMDVKAQYFGRFARIDSLREMLSDHKKDCLFVLGGGSNVLFTQNIEGLVLKNELKGIELWREDAEFYYVRAAGGEVWHQFVLYCIANNYAGIENLSLIPGCVGASPMQNIGAYGVEIKDVFYQLEALSVQDMTVHTFSLQDCGFGYRESVFKKQFKNEFVILNVTFRLRKQPVYHISYGAIQQELEKMGVQDLSIKAISDAVIAIRSSKLPDPKKIGNAGSFFKNPTIPMAQYEILKTQFPDLKAFQVADHPEEMKIAAGWLIEDAGWKGFRQGDAGVHPLQALVLVNYGKATGQEILELSSEIIQSIDEKYGIRLEREVNILPGASE